MAVLHEHSGAAIQNYAAMAGLLFLLSFVGGGFGEAYVPSHIIVAGDAAATAQNLRSSEALFRLGFIAYLVEAVSDAALALIFYVLLRPVSRDLALLAAFFGLLATALFAAAEIFYFSSLHLAGNSAYLQAFSADQRDALALLFLKIFAYGSALFTVFYGLAWMIRGYLIVRSGYLPKLLGALVAFGGFSFAARNVLFVLAPAYASNYFLLAIFPGAVLLAFWLLIRGVNVHKWEKAAVAVS